VSINLIYIAVVIAVIFFSMTIHELMHGMVSFWLGDDTAQRAGRLSLNPLRHIDPFLTIILPVALAVVGAPIFGGAKPVPFDPGKVKGGEWGAALVAIAGPLTNLVLAFLFFGVWVLVGLPTSDLASVILLAGVSVNLGFFVFNLIPIPPLDGSRVIYALAPDFVRAGMDFIERYSVLLVFLLVLLFSRYVGVIITDVSSFFFTVFSHIFGL